MFHTLRKNMTGRREEVKGEQKLRRDEKLSGNDDK